MEDALNVLVVAAIVNGVDTVEAEDAEDCQEEHQKGAALLLSVWVLNVSRFT